MKSYRKELWFKIPSRRAFINITPQIEVCLKERVGVRGDTISGKDSSAVPSG